MILRQKPKNPQLYYSIDEKKSKDLNKNNIFPLYIWGKILYYKKTDKLLKYLKGGDGNL